MCEFYAALSASHLFGPCEKQSHTIVVYIHWIYWDLRDPIIQRTLFKQNLSWSHRVVFHGHSSLLITFFLKVLLLFDPTKETDLQPNHPIVRSTVKFLPIFTVSNQLFSLLNKSLLNVNVNFQRSLETWGKLSMKWTQRKERQCRK